MSMPVRDMVPYLGLCDPLSALSHGVVGLFLLLQAAILLRRAAGDPLRVAVLAVYVAGVGGMFLSSGSYHALLHGHWLKPVLWRLDHGSIWIGLAATHTPVQVLFCSPETTRRRLTRMWSVALTGACLEVVFLQDLPLWVSPLLYVGMGWVCFPVILGAWRHSGAAYAAPLLFAGLVATAGGLTDSCDAPNPAPGLLEAHEITHLCVAFAWYVYWRLIWTHADGRLAAPAQVGALAARWPQGAAAGA